MLQNGTISFVTSKKIQFKSTHKGYVCVLPYSYSVNCIIQECTYFQVFLNGPYIEMVFNVCHDEHYLVMKHLLELSQVKFNNRKCTK